jgi:hypothetical protein
MKGLQMDAIQNAAQVELFRISGERKPFTAKEIKKIDGYIESGLTDPKKLARAIDMLRGDC